MGISKKLDYKKEFPDLYLPKKKPMLIEVPEMTFLRVEGKGNPNTSSAYADALAVLYGLSFGIKMNLKFGRVPKEIIRGMKLEEGSAVWEGNYAVPPLEGLWWSTDEKRAFDGKNLVDKEQLCWFSLIRQPDEVTEELFTWAKEELQKKKPELPVPAARLVRYREGLCAQLLHVGPYDSEPASIELLEQFIREEGYEEDFHIGDLELSKGRYHHEIYLGDPRRTTPERLKTVIRHPVRKKVLREDAE